MLVYPMDKLPVYQKFTKFAKHDEIGIISMTALNSASATISFWLLVRGDAI